MRDIAALGGTLVSAMGDVSGFVHSDLDQAQPMLKAGWGGNSLDFAAANPDVIVGSGEVSGTDSHVIVSTDRGKTWKNAAKLDGVPGVGFGKAATGSDYPAIYISATIGGQDGIFRSTDGGASWSRINDDNHQWAFAGSAITGDPDVYGRVYLSARGVIYGDIAS